MIAEIKPALFYPIACESESKSILRRSGPAPVPGRPRPPKTAPAVIRRLGWLEAEPVGAILARILGELVALPGVVR